MRGQAGLVQHRAPLWSPLQARGQPLRQRKAGDVDAADQPDQSNGSKEHVQGLREVPTEWLGPRLQRDPSPCSSRDRPGPDARQ